LLLEVPAVESSSSANLSIAWASFSNSIGEVITRASRDSRSRWQAKLPGEATVAGESILKKMVHSNSEIPVLHVREISLLPWTQFRRRSSTFGLNPNGIRHPINYGISSTLRKLPVVFQPDKHSAALGVLIPYVLHWLFAS
jgi:hypothetical protein